MHSCIFACFGVKFSFLQKKKHCISTMLFGAVDGARTRDIQLGKLTLYH